MISIVIPAFNEAKFIKETLSALKQCAKNSEMYEVIVVDNGSNDETSAIVSMFYDVTLIKLPLSVTVSRARNIGVESSRGNILAFIDADIIVTQKWWDALVVFTKKFGSDNSELMVSGCKVSISRNPTWIEESWFSCFKMSSLSYINSGNLICTKSVFNLVGGFDVNLRTGEDVDFCARARINNALIIPDNSFVVHHEGYPKTLLDFFKREKWHGIGDLQSINKFLKSKIAMISVLMMCATFLSILFFCMGDFLSGSVIFIVTLVVNFLTLIMRIKIKSIRHFMLSFFLNYIYFFARFFSFVDLLIPNNRSR